MDQAELFEALKTSSEVRQFYGIALNDDGTYWVSDLQKILPLEEETKTMLREFLRQFGKRPGPPQPPPPLATAPDEAVRHPMSDETRRRLDDLYAKLTQLSLTAPSRRYS